MSHFGTTDPALEIPKGNVAGHSHVNKFGESTNVDSGVDTDIWDRANATADQDIWTAPTTARVHQIVSTDVGDTSAGAGARTVRVSGLTSWAANQVSETITMNGTTNVPTVNSYVIIHRMSVLTKGATSANIGIITATADTDTTVTAEIGATNGQTLMAVYGVPSTQIAYMTNYYVSILKAASAASASIKLLVNLEPDAELTNFAVHNAEGVSSDGGGHIQHMFNPYDKIAGPAIVKMQANGSANNLTVSSGFDIILVDN